MSTVKSPRRAPAAPIALQIMGLLLAGIIAAHGVSLLVVILLPPPRPPVWRIIDIAEALRGGPLKLRDGRSLVRSVESAPPPDPRRSPPPGAPPGAGPGGPWRIALARTLNMPVEEVRLVQVRPPVNVLLGALPDLVAPPHRTPVRMARQEHVQTYMLVRHGAGAPEVTMQFARRAPLDMMIVVGEFSAAARLADGRWLVVRAPPEPFPSDWQIRVALWLGGCLLILGLAAWLFSRRITAPIIAFADAAERLGRDPRQGMIPLKGPAEIGKAATAFNRMQERLKRYVDDRTAMMAAISHDMRTPLARIRFKLEAAPEDVKAAVTRDVERMEGMIDAVLSFVRDASEPSRRERLDLRSLVEVVADEAPGAPAPIEVGGDERPVVVDGDPAALTRLFANLLDNAIKHGKNPRLTVSSDAENGIVEIADDGPGVPTAELERVFQPFYRADPARTLTRDGVGLGLAVARSIARAHGGDIVLVNRSPAGLTARVTLPLAARR